MLLSDHSMASSRIIVMKDKIDRITIPQKLGKLMTHTRLQMHVFLFQEYLRVLKMSL